MAPTPQRIFKIGLRYYRVTIQVICSLGVVDIKTKVAFEYRVKSATCRKE